MNPFAILLKELRLQGGKSLRSFCLEHGFDPGNWSRLERGLLTPPQDRKILERYAEALELSSGSDDWFRLFDAAAESRGELPADIRSDQALLDRLPVLYRTVRNRPVDDQDLDGLIDLIRGS